tara:strand:- start:242 stop:2098 length:1857 start_codon:yes stop_codon:yes gene_type:complete
MATYYKYAERQEDAYVDWSVIGKDISDSLLEEKKFREDKKAKIDEDTRQLGVRIDNSPQGQFQDGNKFTLQYASDAQQARLLQDKLLRSGQLSLRDYTVQRQNLNDGTTQIFDLAKLYQEKYKSRMEAYNKKDIQAMNIANLASVEGFADFSKSQAVINAKDGTVSLASLEVDPVTGLKKVTNNIVPVSVLRGKILSEIPTFKVDDAMNKAKAGLGSLVKSVYANATTAGAGTITQLTGPGAISKYPQYAEEIKTFNSAIDKQIGAWFANSYNISSVLTEDTGKYNAESYTFDREVAKADPTKLLLKINPSTQLSILDESAPNYAAQKKEAEGWVRSSFLAKLDSEEKMTTTAQITERSASNMELDDKRRDEKKDTKLFAEMLSNAVSGNTEQVKAGVQYLQGLGVPIERTLNGFEIFDAKKGTTLEYEFGEKMPDDMVKSLLGAVNIKDYNEDDIVSFSKQFNKGKGINLTDTVEGPKKQVAPYTANIPDTIFKDSPKESVSTLQTELKKITGVKGFIVSDVSNGWTNNTVKIQGPSGAYKEFESKANADEAANIKNQIDTFISDEVAKFREKEAKEAEAKKLAKSKTTTTTQTKGKGPLKSTTTRNNNQGVGGKYN